MKIVQATFEHLAETAELFDQYRQFYLQDKSLSLARQFIEERIRQQDSMIYLALADDLRGMGFVQLFPSFSSVAMQRTYILNDLYVNPAFRQRGVAKALMQTAKAFAAKNGASSIKLATAKSNIAAKSLYDDLGYQLIDTFDYYSLKVSD